MKTFTKLREFLLTHKELQKKIDDMEKKYDYQFKIVFDAIKELLAPRIIRKRKPGLKELES